MATANKTFYVENLGCFRNQVDAEYIISSMEQSGYTHVQEPDGAETIVVNTCGFIESAKKESIETFFELKQANPDAKVLIAGCLAQRYGNELLEMIPEADGIFGNRAPELLPKMMEKVEAGERVAWFPQELTTAPPRKNLLSHARSAFIKIAEGCIHHCTFCVIPKIRGGLVSRSMQHVLDEFDDLLARSTYEINLIAQDLASFGREREKLGELVPLLKEMLKRPGKYWIRLFYIHPDTFPEGLIELMQEDARLLPYFDLPFQHSNERILKLMARYGSKQKYLDLVDRIRVALPDAVIRSTFLVGFPGESKMEYAELLDFQAESRLDWMGVFTYSREEQTASYRRQTEEEFEKTRPEAKRRRTTLEARQQAITAQRLDRLIGKEVEVLIEEPVEGSELYLGRSYIQAPEVDGLIVLHGLPDAPLAPGAVVKAQIKTRNGVDLEAVQLAS